MVKESAQPRKTSLRTRLTTLVVVAIFGAVAIVTLSSVWREIAQYGVIKTAELRISADVFAASIADHVRTRNRVAAQKDLQAIAQSPSIYYILVETADGDVFLDYGEPVGLDQERLLAVADDETQRPFSMLMQKSAVARAPIVYEGAEIGSLIVQADASGLSRRIGVLLYDAFVAAVFAAGVGVLIAARMQRSVTNPIRHLAEIMSVVRKTGEFDVRAQRMSDDETGDLVDSFNDMLDQIQERDARLLEHQRNLKKIVRRRTLQLERAKEAAEAASLAKSEFLASMSHEIRTPMNGMLVMAELLNGAQLGPRQKRYADVIVKSGQSLLAIINDILDFSKIEAGRLELEKIPVKPADIVSEVVGLFWERAISAGIELTAYVTPNTPEVVAGDPVRIGQVLSNLVNNALKFTSEGHVIVSARRVKKGEGCTIEFAVEDTGVGIAEEKQKAIFEAFSQADQSTTRKFGGTGLGLAISRRLVEAMDGAIAVKSAAGEGSRFSFRFPTRIIEPPKRAPIAENDKLAVIAIDGEATADVLARYLREAHVESKIIEPKGVDTPNLAQADIIFASPDYLDAFHRASKGDPDRWIPARVCVSELGDSESDRQLETGVSEAVLIKPLSRREVMNQIERFLGGLAPDRNVLRRTRNEDQATPPFSGKRVLAADDSAVNREVVGEALASLGVDVVMVEDGAAAVNAAVERPFDLIFMDCSMPVMDGFEATRAIRQAEANSRNKRTPIIALTAHVSGSGEKWREAGMDRRLSKPFTMKALSDVMSEFLGPAAPPSPESARSPEPGQAAGETSDQRGDSLSVDEPFDPAVLEEIAQIRSKEGNLVARALDLFETHSKDALLALTRAVKDDDSAAIEKAAHALKSMSLNAGARRLASACEAVESSAHEKSDSSTLAPLVLKLRNEYKATLAALPETRAKYASKAA